MSKLERRGKKNEKKVEVWNQKGNANIPELEAITRVNFFTLDLKLQFF